MKCHAFAPATVANFIIGFDTLGAAISSLEGMLLGDTVYIEESSELAFNITGSFSHKLPSDPQKNLVLQCRDLFHSKLHEIHVQPQNLSLMLEKNLPVGSGLGSSATSIVATLVALNAFYEDIFSKTELLKMAGMMEGKISGSIHYDNVAPCLLGSLQLMLPKNEKICVSLPFFNDWYFAIYYPGIEVSTAMARKVLPAHYALPEITVYWQKLASFIHALYSQDKELALSLLQDELIEPHRRKLVPGITEAHQVAMEAGALTFGLSGSGPTCFAITDSIEVAKSVISAIDHVMPKQPDSFSSICCLDLAGARVLR